MADKPFRPMEPVLWPSPFDDPEWLFQPKWDGVRMVGYLDRQRVSLFNRHGRDRTSQYPELVKALRDRFPGARAVLDGEAVVFWENKTSFPRVMQRELATRPEAIKTLSALLPVTYMVFDLVRLNGRDIMQLELEERLGLLQQHLPSREPVLLTDSFPVHGCLLFEAMRDRGWEGMVAKRGASRYLPGVKSQDWRKVKIRRQQLCLVGGFITGARGLASLLLGVSQEGRLLYVGRAGSGLSEEQLRRLRSYLEKTVTATCPFMPAPVFTRTDVRWVEPSLTVLVEYSEWTERLQLRHPVIRGLTWEPVDSCHLP